MRRKPPETREIAVVDASDLNNPLSLWYAAKVTVTFNKNGVQSQQTFERGSDAYDALKKDADIESISKLQEQLASMTAGETAHPELHQYAMVAESKIVESHEIHRQVLRAKAEQDEKVRAALLAVAGKKVVYRCGHEYWDEHYGEVIEQVAAEVAASAGLKPKAAAPRLVASAGRLTA